MRSEEMQRAKREIESLRNSDDAKKKVAKLHLLVVQIVPFRWMVLLNIVHIEPIQCNVYIS